MSSTGGQAPSGSGTEAADVADPLPFNDDPLKVKATTLVGVVAPFVATLGVILRWWGEGVGWMEVSLLAGGWILTGLCISVGYHRMLTHRAFKAAAPVRAVLLSLGAMALQGAPGDWAATHARHHAHADKEGDPHSPLEGFWHAHLGWLMRDRFVRSGPIYERIREDPVVRWIDRLWPAFAIATFAIPAAIGGLWTGTWTGAASGLLWGGLIRVFIGHHITWSVNSLSHMFGSRPYRTDDEARNNPIVAILGFGEGWHNNHHAFPKSAFLGHSWWQFDPGRWVISGLEALGLVWDVEIPDEEVRQRRSQAG